ncbi:MAG: hypothetical protein ACKODB_10715, partial [Betaproteobacteria bacterium]
MNPEGPGRAPDGRGGGAEDTTSGRLAADPGRAIDSAEAGRATVSADPGAPGTAEAAAPTGDKAPENSSMIAADVLEGAVLKGPTEPAPQPTVDSTAALARARHAKGME